MSTRFPALNFFSSGLRSGYMWLDRDETTVWAHLCVSDIPRSILQTTYASISWIHVERGNPGPWLLADVPSLIQKLVPQSSSTTSPPWNYLYNGTGAQHTGLHSRTLHCVMGRGTINVEGDRAFRPYSYIHPLSSDRSLRSMITPA